MTVSSVLDSAGRRRSPATMPGYRAGRPPRNKGMLYPADLPTVEEVVTVMRHASEDHHGWRLRAVIIMLWRGGLHVQEALALTERDLDPVLVRHGKGGLRRRGRYGPMGLRAAAAVLSERVEMPVGPAVLHHRRPYPRATLVKRRSPRRVSPTATLVASAGCSRGVLAAAQDRWPVVAL